VINLSDDMRREIGQVDLSGVIVVEVTNGSPAESIGIAPGDVITAFASAAIESVSILRDAVRAAHPGDLVDITYLRDSRAVSEAVRVARSIPEYVRHVSFREQRIRPEDVRARIEVLRTEIELLRTQLKEIEKQQ
jgi:C-terminal processing protease CtpA/Prc